VLSGLHLLSTCLPIMMILYLRHTTSHITSQYGITDRGNPSRPVSSASRTAEKPRRRSYVTRRWPRRCTTRDSTVSSAERSATSCSALEADQRASLYLRHNISPSPPGLHCVYIRRLVEASSFFLVPGGKDWALIIPAWAVRLQAFFPRLGHRSLLASKTNVFI
jgi:hypothetical protein